MSEPAPQVMARFVGIENVEHGRDYLKRLDPTRRAPKPLVLRRRSRACLPAEHAYPEPTIRFADSREEGFRALAVALEHRFPVQAIRRYWDVLEGEPRGPNWEMTFG
jgi:hypothetical protein